MSSNLAVTAGDDDMDGDVEVPGHSVVNDGDGNDSNEDGDEEDDGDDDGDDDSSESAKPPPKKVLPQRTTRGRRRNRLVGDAAEADESFWGQDAFKEDESDESVSSNDLEDSSGGSESTDSDIDLPEPEDGADDEGGGAGARGRGGRGRGKGAARGGGHVASFVEDDDVGGQGGRGRGRGGRGRGVYMDPALRALRGMESFGTAVAALTVGGAVAEGGTPGSMRMRKRVSMGGLEGVEVLLEGEGGVHGVGVGPPGKRGKRAGAGASGEDDDDGISTPSAAAVKLSQEEVLIEAAGTTLESERVLDSMVRVEAERAAKQAADMSRAGRGHAFPVGMPILRFHSKRGAPDTLTFLEVDSVPTAICGSGGAGGSRQARCAVTGRPARYRDPLTGLPYSDAAAFKALRVRHACASAGGGSARSGDRDVNLV